MATKPLKTGVCYYPEHWPENDWAEDARHMRELGISVVRVGEFAWSRLEATPGTFTLDWMFRALDILGDAGLEVCMGTPTATPPKWLIDEYPDIVAYDADGMPRKFGSRRHYCFSSPIYREQSRRITEIVAMAFGEHAAVKYWQTDNEYGCHNTVRSYSPAARTAFQHWLQARYNNIGDLNTAWGTVFWSQEYQRFDQIDLPNLTVTEPNPSHVLDFYRFSSDQVVSFNKEQVDIIRAHSPGRPITHNYMGFYAEFDHFDVGEDLDFASWDSYPLGFLDQGWDSAATKQRYMRQGHPDFAGFHHDLYRAVGKGNLWVMEQQPGAVNWAPHNPAPLPGMIAAWSLEAYGHGAETVSYFRWRQAPFGQEQMHAGLLLPNRQPAPAAEEAKTTATLIDGKDASEKKAAVALVFSYDAFWMFEVQPQGAGWHYWQLVVDWYGALRQKGLSIDIVKPESDLSGYQAVFIPSLPYVSLAMKRSLEGTDAAIVFGPRSGSKTRDMQIPENLAPGPLSDLLDISIPRVESFRPDHIMQATWQGVPITASIWLDHVTGGEPIVSTEDGSGLFYRNGRYTYVAGVPDKSFLGLIIDYIGKRAGLDLIDLPEGMRLRDTASLSMLINYAPEAQDIPKALTETFVLDQLPAGSARLIAKG